MFRVFASRALSSKKLPRLDVQEIQALSLRLPTDYFGGLRKSIDVLVEHGISLANIQSQPTSPLESSAGLVFRLDLETANYSSPLSQVIAALQAKGISAEIAESKEVPWFPRTLEELDLLTRDGGEELQNDLPPIEDPEYRERRRMFDEVAHSCSITSDGIPRIEYTAQELGTWGLVYKTLYPLICEHACDDYLYHFREMHAECGYREDNIPQLDDISRYIFARTGFKMRPTSTVIPAREFLACLAFRVFPMTQFIRQHTCPFFALEPDVIHELMGHAPMLADQHFADFSQQVGLASLGASDDDIAKLGNCYLASSEFGVVENARTKRKIFGAGILGSVQEMRNATNGESLSRYFDPKVTESYMCPLRTLQPCYWASESIEEAKQVFLKYANNMPKAVTTSWNKQSRSIKVHQRAHASPNS